MRIKLKKGKQRDLILLSKDKFTWKELASQLKINHQYLSRDLRNEKVFLSEEIYNKLCSIARVDFDKYIEEKLNNDWGRSKGGKTSKGSRIKIVKPIISEKLAEFIGAVLGDGNICYHSKGKKIGVYQIKIAGDLEKDKDYHLNYLRNICKEVFNLEAREIITPKERFLSCSSIELVKFFMNMGLKSGNKIKNQITIPNWIWEKDSFLRACLRGLIDTDGSIFRMSNKDPQLLRISFTNYNISLLEDTRKAFIKLGFAPSKIILNKQFFISRKSDISKYLKEIGFSNEKHLNRIKKLNSPMV